MKKILVFSFLILAFGSWATASTELSKVQTEESLRERAVKILEAESPERFKLYQEANAKLSALPNSNPAALSKYQDSVLYALMSEANQRNSIFTLDKIVDSYKQTVGKGRKLDDLIFIIDRYTVLLAAENKTADPSTLRLAILELVKLREPNQTKDKMESRATELEGQVALFKIEAKNTSAPSTRR